MDTATVDAVYAVVGYLAREWGEHGYRLSVEGSRSGGAIAHVVHSDGSRFVILADRWGNVLGHGDTVESVIAHDAQVTA